MKKTFLSLSLALAVLLPCAALAQATAKPAPPLRAPEEVIVTQSTSGTEVRGRIVELSSSTLAMLVDGKRVTMPIDTVLRIDARTDPVKNGAVIGASVMGGLSLLACAGHRDAVFCLWGSAVNTAFGALAGAGIDALHKGRTTIYSKPSGTALTVAPTRGGARAQLTLRW